MYYSFTHSLLFFNYQSTEKKHTPGGYIIIYDDYNSYKDNYLPPHPKDNCLEDNIGLENAYGWYKGEIPPSVKKGKHNSHKQATPPPRTTRSSSNKINNNKKKKELRDSDDDEGGEEQQPVRSSSSNSKKKVSPIDVEEYHVEEDDDEEEEQQQKVTTTILPKGVTQEFLESVLESEQSKKIKRARNATK